MFDISFNISCLLFNIYFQFIYIKILTYQEVEVIKNRHFIFGTFLLFFMLPFYTGNDGGDKAGRGDLGREDGGDDEEDVIPTISRYGSSKCT